MKRHLKVWFWKSFVGELLDIAAVEAKDRAAKACGCDACRTVFDEAFREKVTHDALAVLRAQHEAHQGKPS